MASASAATEVAVASEEILLLYLALRARSGAGAWSMKRTTTKKATTCGQIYPRLWQRRQDRGGDWDQEQFWGGVGGYGRGGGDDDIALGTILMRINKNNKCITNTPIYNYFNQNKNARDYPKGRLIPHGPTQVSLAWPPPPSYISHRPCHPHRCLQRSCCMASSLSPHLIYPKITLLYHNHFQVSPSEMSPS